MINYDFRGKNVIVTGASMGLGYAIALEFVKAGASLIIADINLEEAEKAKEKLSQYGTRIETYKIDVSNYDEFLSLANYVENTFGSIDILVNNAGIFVAEMFNDMEIAKMDKLINVNLNGTVYGCRAVLPVMKKQQYGKVINISSIAAKLGGSGAAIYSATKAAVLELTACLAREYAKDNININCVLPGIIRTPLWEKALDEMTKGDISKKDTVFAQFTKDIPMGRPQEPVDIAKAVLFLCSEEASNITAQNLAIDGGHTY